MNKQWIHFVYAGLTLTEPGKDANLTPGVSFAANPLNDGSFLKLNSDAVKSL